MTIAIEVAAGIWLACLSPVALWVLGCLAAAVLVGPFWALGQCLDSIAALSSKRDKPWKPSGPGRYCGVSGEVTRIRG